MVGTAHAALINFDNCLPDTYKRSDPPPLQWVPKQLDARFDYSADNNTLQVIMWGNVTGSRFTSPLPPPGSPLWDDPDEQNGKIFRNPEGQSTKITTLLTKVDFLSYGTPNVLGDFCNDRLVNAQCPLAPVFDANILPLELPSVNLTRNFTSSYAFTSFSATFILIYGDHNATNIGCVSATITPDLGAHAGLVAWLPLVILILVAFATIFASIFSPWGTTDVFRWTSNFGRDADLLRLVTPGFGDCLQYIQFVVLTGGLSLSYPGFYQPIVSQAGWSVLMFNESLASNKPGWQAVQDGIYVTDFGTEGLQRLAQLMGIPDVEDIWVGMIVWLLVIIAIILVLIQLGFFLRWMFRLLTHSSEEDLRAKNLPFSLGNIIRIVFNYFLLPIVALSTYQLAVAGESKNLPVGLAAVTLVILVGFAAWLLFLIIRTRPRAVLFDDLPTVLLYGPLYNTYSDEAATFALIPVVLTFVRGIAIGGVQTAGIAQIVMLAICEVVQVLTVHAFRPFSSPTSMNAYHTLFSVLRFTTVMLMVAFIEELGVTEGPKGWIGYAILITHAGVLILGFLLNALQTIVEVSARLMGAGGEDGLARGGLAKIFGMRQLQRRISRRGAAPSRQSQISSAAMLDREEVTKAGYTLANGRGRSESAGSGFLLRGHNRNSSALDSIDALSMPARAMDSGSVFTPTTPGEASTFSFLPSPGAATRPQAVLNMEASDPYYRPPRMRGDTLTGSFSSDRRRSIADSRRYSQVLGVPDGNDNNDLPIDRAQTPAPAPVTLPQRADYATREVDFYYGVRGPALNSDGLGRRLGTGPADPTGPMASAAGWFRTMFGAKTKEKGKGFEVVRSARMPPGMRGPGGEFSDEPPPEGIPVAMGVIRNGPIDSDDDEPTRKAPEPTQSDLLTGDASTIGGDAPRVSDAPPTLPGIDAGDSLGFPSRAVSTASGQTYTSRRAEVQHPEFDLEVPEIPRKSSKRHSGADFPTPSFNVVPPTSPAGRGPQLPLHGASSGDLGHSETGGPLPFHRSESQRRLSGSSMGVTDDSNQEASVSPSPDDRPTSFGFVTQHSINRVDPGQMHDVDLLGTSAELVDERNASRRNSPQGRSF
ncbi:integral membrane protein, partial [Plectosphaerella plurivora]